MLVSIHKHGSIINTTYCVDIGVTDNLRREESLTRARTEEAAHNTVGKIHFMSDFSHSYSHFAYIRLHFGRTVQVPGNITAFNVLSTRVSLNEDKHNFYLLVEIAETDVELLEPSVQLALVRPDVQLLHQLGHDEKRPPAAYLFRL